MRLNGEVIAVATFRQSDPKGIGSGLSGGVLSSALRTLMELPRSGEASIAGVPLPPMPNAGIPLSKLRDIADTTDDDYYYAYTDIATGPFQITITSALSRMVGALSLGKESGKERAKREQRADVPISERYRALASIRDWLEYVGDAALPVFAVRITPRMSETTASRIDRALFAAIIGADATATYRFDGDVRAARFLREGEAFDPFRGGHSPQRVNIDNEWIIMKDVADFGFYILPPESFAPLASGSPPEIVIEVDDLKTRKTYRENLDRYVVARMWNDYAGIFRSASHGPPRALYRFVRQCPINSGAGAMGVTAGSPVDSLTSCTFVLGPPMSAH